MISSIPWSAVLLSMVFLNVGSIIWYFCLMHRMAQKAEAAF